MNYYPYLIALHIIFIVTWFSALFYIVRLFIYHTEALQKTEPDRTILSDQFKIMEKRLMNIIGTPSMLLVVTTGICLLTINSQFLQESWLHIKLLFVVCVIIYHTICLRILKKLSHSTSRLTSPQLRMFNELATIFLVAIIFLVELKNLTDTARGFVALILLALVLMFAIKLYQRSRSGNK